MLFYLSMAYQNVDERDLTTVLNSLSIIRVVLGHLRSLLGPELVPPDLVLLNSKVLDLHFCNALLAPSSTKLNYLQDVVVLNDDMWPVHVLRGDELLMSLAHFRIISINKGLKTSMRLFRK